MLVKTLTALVLFFLTQATVLVASSVSPSALSQPVVSKKHHDDEDPRSWRVAKIGLCGGHAVHGFVVETQDGKRHGMLVGHDGLSMRVNDSASLRVRGCSWVTPHQSTDYIVRISGHNLKSNTAAYLCHSLRITFRSGKYIEHVGGYSGWRGDFFSWDVSENEGNFYANELQFSDGACTGIQGVETLEPLKYTVARGHASVKLPGSIPSYFSGTERPSPLDSFSMLITRVCLCGGAAVHGLVFEHFDGTRSGLLLGNDPTVSMPLTDEAIAQRGGRWVNIQEPGGYITEIRGNQLPSTLPSYLCHSLSLTFASGQVVTYKSDHKGWKAEKFSVNVPSDSFFVNQLLFDNGSCVGLAGFRTVLHTDASLSDGDLSDVPTCLLQARKLMLKASKLDAKIDNDGPLGIYRLVRTPAQKARRIKLGTAKVAKLKSQAMTFREDAAAMELDVHEKQLKHLHRALENWFSERHGNKTVPEDEEIYSLIKLVGIDICEVTEEKDENLHVLMDQLKKRMDLIDKGVHIMKDINEITPLPKMLCIGRARIEDETASEDIMSLDDLLALDSARDDVKLDAQLDAKTPKMMSSKDKLAVVFWVNVALLSLLNPL